MSNSAFTPTTTEVTTEVPVNVPVVTAWEAYTPTFEGLGTVSSVSALWRRIGDTIEITGNMTAGTVTAVAVTISLPSGLTLDSTKLSGGGQVPILGSIFRANATSTGIPAATRGPWVIIESRGTSTAKVYVAVNSGTAGAGVFEAVLGSGMTASGEIITFQFRAPISQWAGSGTTTLATRAVEEYAWNSDPGGAANTTYSNSAFFGNGPNGTAFIGTNGTTSGYSSTKYRVRFASTILSTDTLVLEVSTDRVTWQRVENSLDIIPIDASGNYIYGMGFRAVSGSNTDVDVVLGNGGRTRSETSTTFSSVGQNWSEIAGSRYWRLRKVSGGAQVGYPVSARNIVGDTSGTSVPVGMLGEFIQATLNSNTAITSVSSTTQTDITGSTITLTPGVWMISYSVPTFIGGTFGTGGGLRANIRVTDSSNNLVSKTISFMQFGDGAISGFSSLVQQMSSSTVITISTTTSYKLRAMFNQNGTVTSPQFILIGSGSSTALLSDPDSSANFYAVRIA